MKQKDSLSMGDNISSIVESGLCCECGGCEAVCPVEAIKLTLDKAKGYYRPVINEKCIHCRKCLHVCPGPGVDIPFLEGKMSASRFSPVFRKYEKVIIGASQKQEHRFNAASGGLVTELLVYLMTTGRIQGVAIAQNGCDPANPLENTVTLATTPEAIRAGKGSRYTPVPMNVALRQILMRDGIWGFIGLPCHVHGLRLMQEQNPCLYQKLPYVFGLFCASTNTYLSLEYYAWRNHIPYPEMKKIDYRGQGWPGNITFYGEGKSFTFKRVGEKRRDLQWNKTSAFHFDFMLPRCMVCPDQTAFLADMSFGDPHEESMYKTETIGLTWAIVRNASMLPILEEARLAGAIFYEAYPLERAEHAQNYAYKNNVQMRMKLWKWLGKKVPDFKLDLGRVHYRGMIAQMRYLSAFFTCHKWTWRFLKIWFFSTSWFGKRIEIILNRVCRPV